MKKTYLFAVLAVLLSSLACSFGSGLPNGEHEPVETSNVLFQDDFASNTTGWPTIRTEEGITDYEDGVYRILVSLDNQDYFATPDFSLPSDVRIEVDATKVGGADDNDFGILCRYQDNNNYYQFVISSDGYVGILSVVDGTMQSLSDESLVENTAVNMGDAQNHIRADCIGNTLTLFVNSQQVSTAQDSSFTGGDVGLFAGTYDTPGTDIYFDNFMVTAP